MGEAGHLSRGSCTQTVQPTLGHHAMQYATIVNYVSQESHITH